MRENSNRRNAAPYLVLVGGAAVPRFVKAAALRLLPGGRASEVQMSFADHAVPVTTQPCASAPFTPGFTPLETMHGNFSPRS